ncbi:sporulation histidine kinase inhibitor Sda [Neobacillus sp. D3-1R]|uniref:sporulation histidine kinase inhibitor Sda n=1 Tax=Neobacillus sp. D3-1R TaxID=3445778 RepID=UPI003F9FC70A
MENHSNGTGVRPIMSSFLVLDNESLLHTYYSAIKYQLESDFIMILESEIKSRNIAF